MVSRTRKSIRLKGYDYAQPAEYFVTIRSANGRHIFGTIREGKMSLSEVGKIANSCWQEIPKHFPNSRADIVQVMPNHVHGIVEIKEETRQGTPVGTRPARPEESSCSRSGGHTVSVQEFVGRQFGKPQPGSLSTILGSFKSAVTKKVHEKGLTSEKSIWQSRFHDHIIRDACEHFFIERYILLNPIMWQLDVENPTGERISLETLEVILRDTYGLEGRELDRILNYEMNYRRWAGRTHL
jgi:putative transposase